VSQQLAIIVLVDVAAALEARTLEDNIYLLDNMKLQGSTGEGTGELVSAINGSYWSDGSQASEQVLNWLLYSLGSLPPTVPRNYAANRVRESDAQALDAVGDLAGRAGSAHTDVAAELGEIQRSIGTGTTVRSTNRSGGRAGHKILDLTGQVVTQRPGEAPPALAHPAPVLTDITGEAVDSKIIYPAAYGSPDLVTDGWYWSASVDTSRPGTYAYSMEIELHELVESDGEWHWVPVRLTYESAIRISSDPRRNGFTKAGLGLLPIAPPGPLDTPDLTDLTRDTP
jgi:hypothetical protein